MSLDASWRPSLPGRWPGEKVTATLVSMNSSCRRRVTKTCPRTALSPLRSGTTFQKEPDVGGPAVLNGRAPCSRLGSVANEEVLTGGNSSVVVRVGDTVRRNSGPWTTAVHALLDALHTAGVTGVPVAAGLDELEREVVSFLPGDTVQYPLPAWVWHPSILRDAGKLLRQIHNASIAVVRTPLTWQLPTHGPVEVVCHNDFAPYNMVFQDRKFVGVFDFDAASPGPRIWDFAYLAYQLVPLIQGAGPGEPGAAEKLPRLDDLTRAYGYPFTHREVFESLAARLLELADYSARRAAETGRAELNDHAAMYRRDSTRMVRLATDA